MSGCFRDLYLHVDELVVDRCVISREEIPHFFAEIGKRGYVSGVCGLVIV